MSSHDQSTSKKIHDATPGIDRGRAGAVDLGDVECIPQPYHRSARSPDWITSLVAETVESGPQTEILWM